MGNRAFPCRLLLFLVASLPVPSTVGFDRHTKGTRTGTRVFLLVVIRHDDPPLLSYVVVE